MLVNAKLHFLSDLLKGNKNSLLQVFDGRMEGLKSLNRSSDAILSYSEETGTPIFTIDTSLMLSNLTFKSGAKGQVCSGV